MEKNIKEDDFVISVVKTSNVTPDGVIGRVFAVYDTEPNSYEVVFFENTGDEISVFMYNDEVVKYVKPEKPA